MNILNKTISKIIIAIVLVYLQSTNITTCIGQIVRNDLTPKKDTIKLCKNPWKGWYHHFYDANFRTYVPSSDSDLDNFPGIDHLYVRLSWSYFEPVEGQYNWKIIDDLIAKWGPKGYKFSFRVTAYDPYEVIYATPEWVKNAGAKGEFISIEWDTKQYWEPDYDDPIFLEKWNNFQKAMAAKYDGNPQVSYIDVSYGTWGEGHTSFGDRRKATLALLKKSVDIYTNNFTKTPLVMSEDLLTYNLGYGTVEGEDFRNYVESRGISYRDDSPLVGWYVGYYPNSYSVATPSIFENSYKNRLTVMEAQHYGHVKSDGNWQGQDGSIKGGDIFRGAMRTLHATYIGYQGYANEWLKDNPNLAKQLLNECGYWYSIKTSEIPTKVLQGSNVNISLQWHNYGVAPAYKPYEIHFKLIGAETKKFVIANSNNKTWMDNSSKTESYTFLVPQNMLSGSYAVKVKLYDPASRKNIDLGMNNNIKDVEGFFNIGSIIIGDQATVILPPTTPELISASANSESQISLQWIDYSSNEEGFVVERKVTGGTFLEVAQVLPGTTTYQDKGLNPGSNYIYRIGAYNSIGTSYSKELTCSTFSLGPNIIANPSFEADKAYTQTPMSWKSSNAVDTEYVENKDGGYTGSFHGTHWGSVAYNTSTFQAVTGLENGTYVLSAYVRSSGGQSLSKMEVSGFGGTSIDVNILQASGWVKTTISNIEVTNNQCTISFISNANAYQWIHFDEVQLSKIIPTNVTSIDESLSEEIKIYPSPATEKLEVELSEGSGSLSIEMYNNLGIKVYSSELMNSSFSINLEGKAPGVYHVKIIQNGRSTYKRIYIQ